jgi:hypothetical protein
MKGTAGLNKMGPRPTLRTQLLYCKSSFVSAMLGVAFGHRDLQTFPRQTSFCEDFTKKNYSNTPRSLEKLKHITEQNVANSNPETLSKVPRIILTWVDTCLGEGGGHFNHLL